MKSLNKLFAFASVLLLASCGSAPASSSSSKSTPEVEKDAKGFEVIRHNDALTGIETEFHKMPKVYEKVSSKPGRVEKVTYTTSVYGEETYEKACNVYLPYGYDQANTSKKYNIIYMQHGDKRSENDLVDPSKETTDYKNLLDNMFDPDKGGIDPAIIVFPTFYLNADHTLAGDGAMEGVPNNYHLEITTELMPLVEEKYNTYTESYDAEGLIAARDHRAFSGYSRGSCATWMMMIQELPYFRYWMPMSANSVGTHHNMGKDNEAFEAIWAEHKEAIDNCDLPFYVYAAGGINEARNMHLWMDHLLSKTDYFSYGSNQAENNIFYTVSDFTHMDEYSVYYYYNTLQIVFHQ